jgi:phosphoserine phosphatase RsbU/P
MIELKYGTRKVVSFRGAKKVVGGLSDKNKISVLLYISKEFAKVGKEGELFSKVMSLCKEIFECDNATLRLFDGDYLVPVKYMTETEPPRRNILPSEGFSGHTFTQKSPLLITNLINTKFIDEEERTRCVICVPIISKDEVMGTLSVESNTEYFYKEDDLEILEALGAQLALALNGVRLIEGLMTARAREAAVLSQLEWDLRMGRNVQNQILQMETPPWNGLFFGSYFEPMVEVSGDYFGIVKQGNMMTVLIADVSGHGIPAALVTMGIHYQFNQYVLQGLGLTEIMEGMGEALKPQLPESTYFTAFIIRFYSDYSYSYVNAGHQKLVHFKNSGEIEDLDTMGLPLGILDVHKNDFEEKQGKINPGDYLMVFTDGFTEQKNEKGEEYGFDNLKKLFLEKRFQYLEKNGKCWAKDIIKGMMDDWRSFKGSKSNGDDLTMLLIECNQNINTALPMIRSAKTAIKMKNVSDAFTLADEAYKIDPSLKDNLILLAKMYYNEKRYEESVRFFSEYIKTSGEDTAIIHYLHGKALYNCKRYSEAKLSLKKSLSCDHTFAKSSLLLAKCYMEEKEIPKAIKTLQRGVKSSPTDSRLIDSLKKLEGISLVVNA